MPKTKIAVTADIHYGTLVKREGLEKYVELITRKQVDVLVIAGDLVSRGAHHESFVEFLDILSAFPGKVMATPGNHDLWTRKGNSMDLLTREIAAMMGERGMILLDGNPQLVGELGIVGSVGWYDYSFRHVPREFLSHFESFLFRFPDGNGGYVIKRWSDLEDADYREKTCVVSDDGEKWKKSTWQDQRFICWDMEDRQFLDYTMDQLSRDIQAVSAHTQRVMAVTHHLPFSMFVPDIPDPTWGFHRAFLGSDRMGELLLSYPQVQYAFFGHNHRDSFAKVGHINAHNVFFHRGPGTYFMEV